MTVPLANFDPSLALKSTQPIDQINTSADVANRSPVTILMVDDDPSKLLSYEVILESLNERLIRVGSGREALDFLLREKVAVVLMDVSMPEIDGFELADMMRQHPRFQETPIIFVSAVHMSDVDRIRGYRSGAVDYISVPVIPEVLRAKVSVFADLYRKNHQLQELNQELEARVAERSEKLRNVNQQLQERVAELESIMKVLPVGVAIAHDPGCNRITGNAALSEIFGAKPGENIAYGALSADYRIYHDGKSLPEAELPVQRAVQKKMATGLSELEIRRNGKPSSFLLASASPLFDDTGSIRGAVGAFFDVSERRYMEETLRERAELLDLATEAIMVRDFDGSIRFWNAGAEELYGWSRDEAMGASSHELLGTKFPTSKEDIDRVLSDKGRWEGNLTHRSKTGRQIVVASRQAIKLDSSLVLEINRDITSQLIAEEALRRNDRLAAMGKVAGIVAHEINNPLESITNAFYLLRGHPSLDEEARYYARLADQELTRVSHITRQTLSFYRESQQAVAVSIVELMDDVLALQQHLIQAAHITLDKRYRTKGDVVGFPVELKQVFMNLVNNAIHAMSSGGSLRITISASGVHRKTSNVSIRISDSGSGIRAEDAPRLFEPFFSTKETKGTGLGLWISKGIVQKHEGALQFRSIFGPGRAVTCFQIVLPADGNLAD